MILNDYLLLTVHRHYNMTTNKLQKIFNTVSLFNKIVVFPVHPRTRKHIIKENINIGSVKLIDPTNFTDMIILQKNCHFIITDSGGIQMEAFYLGKKCIVARTETEWTETIDCGNSMLINLDDNEMFIYQSIISFLQKKSKPLDIKVNSSEEIVKILKMYH